MGIRDEYGGLSPVPRDAGGGEERYDAEMDETYIEEREELVRVLEAEEAWIATHTAFTGDETLAARYEEAADLVEGLVYGEEAIQGYCRQRTWEGDDHSTVRHGLFLSALINLHDGEAYTLPDLSVDIGDGHREGLSYVGYRNEKDVTVEGTVGARAGMLMRGGQLDVAGHAGADTGHGMEGGTIHVRGSAGGLSFDSVGRGLEGGTLVVEGTVYGDAAEGMQGGTFRLGGEVTGSVGPGMEGGTVELHGNAFLSPDIEGGTVYRVRSGDRRRVWPVPDLGVPEQDAVEELWEACRAWRQAGKGYKDAKAVVEELDYGRDAIYTFAEHAVMDDADGHFVSALINLHDGDTYRLPDMSGVTFVGSHTADTITVEGSVGGFAGAQLDGGSLTVEGDAENHVGYAMTGGSITVEGSVGENCGERLQDGHIEVYGDAGAAVGEGMDDGRIRVHGAVDGYEDITWDGVIQQMQDGEWVELSQGFPEGER